MTRLISAIADLGQQWHTVHCQKRPEEAFQASSSISGSSDKRILEIDFLRSLSMLSVLVGHVSSTYIYQETHWQFNGINMGFFFNQAARFSVPLFLLLSGFSLWVGGQPASCRAFWKGRVRRVLLPYAVWLLLYSFANTGFSFPAWLAQLADPAWLVRTFLTGQSAPQLYFIPILFQCYLLYPLLRSWVERDPVKWVAWTMAVTLLLQGGYVLQDLDLLPGTLPAHLWLLFPVWCFYFVAGMCLGQVDWPSLCSLCRRLAPALTVVCGLSSVLYCALSYRTGLLHAIKPELMPGVVLVFLWGVGAWGRWGNWLRVRQATAFLARYSMGIYYNHVLVIYFLRKFPRFQQGMSGMALLFLSTLALSVVLAVGLGALVSLWRRKKWGAWGPDG